jgi:hypothetical protein
MKRVSYWIICLCLGSCVAFDESLLDPSEDAAVDVAPTDAQDVSTDVSQDISLDTGTDSASDTGQDVATDTGSDTADTAPPPVQCFSFNHNPTVDSTFDHYYLGDAGESCPTVCETYGGVDGGTLNVVGQNGTNGRIYFCEDVLQGLMSSSATVSNDTTTFPTKGLGCALHVSSGLFKRYIGVDTTQAASDAAVRRVCACVNPC